MQTAEQNSIHHKLNEFIRKYYTNQLIQGAIYFAGIFLVFYLLVSLLEYYGQFGIAMRTALFYLFVVANLFVLCLWVLVPLLKLNKIGKIMSNEEASEIIGKHFSTIQDKLLNVLQLQSAYASADVHRQSISLLEAGIHQKINELSPIPFSAAIDFKKNSKYAKYVAAPLLLLLLILVIAPNIIKDSTQRLVAHSTHFEKQAPFQFSVLNKKLNVPMQEDFLLELKVNGQEIPEEVFLLIEEREYKLPKKGKNTFGFLFKNVQKNIPFTFYADGFSSKGYELVALPKPLLVDFSLELNYPNYVGKKDETLHNIGDVVIPAGTKVTWLFNTQNAKQMLLKIADSSYYATLTHANTFSASRVFINNQPYSISIANEFMRNSDSTSYLIDVIPDAPPTITVEEKADSISLKQFYYAGSISDDYGFKKLTFNYHQRSTADSIKKPNTTLQSVVIPISPSITNQPFQYLWDRSNLAIAPGDIIEYYFEVGDNDAINGSKSVKSQTFVYHAPQLNEIEKQADKNNAELKKEMDRTIKEAKTIQKEMQDLYKKIVEKKNLTWEEQKKLETLVKQQKELQEKVKNIQNENSRNNQQKNEFEKPSEQLLQKQDELQKLMESVMNDEMKKMMQEMDKLMEKMDKNKIQEMLEKMQLSNKDIEKNLDRNLELFKKLEWEQKMQKTIDKLSELSNKQDELANKTAEKKTDKNDLAKEQDSLTNQFDNLKKDIQDLERKNGELENQQKIPDTKAQQEDISKEQQSAGNQLKEGKKGNASPSQKSASQKMNQMAQQMQEAMNQAEAQQQEEDEQAIREILNNLIELSFNQEQVMKDAQMISTENPQYVKLSQQQKKLKDDAKMVEDSLLAISKRQPAIQPAVNKEISAINTNMERSIELMSKREARFSPSIGSRQQFSMTSINNLALLLNEALNQIKSSSKKSSSCSKPGNCKKPGQGEKPIAGSMSKLQEQIKKQMEALKKSMQEGKKQGGLKGNNGWSQELVRIAAQQEALKQMIQQMQQEGGMSPGDSKNMIKKIDESQKDIVNQRLNEETIKRQNEIMEKLLDFEKAEKEREMEKKRQAEQPQGEYNRNLSLLMKYNLKKQNETELLKTIPPSFNHYYKTKVTEYFNNLVNE
jgi:hypothetical protein